MKSAFIVFGTTGIARYPEFFKALKKRDLLVFAFDEIPGNFSTMEKYSDHLLWQLDELIWVKHDELTKILQKVWEYSQNYHIAGVVAIKEIFVESAAIVADLFGLHFPGLRASRISRNKFQQRIIYKEFSPPVKIIMPNKSKDINNFFNEYPAIIKPLKMHSSIGIRLIEDDQDLQRAIKDYGEEPLLLEKRVLGREYSVESLVQNGIIKFASITEKRTNEEGTSYFVEMAHTVPATNITSQESSNLLNVNNKVLEKLSIQDGVTHAEYKITSNGDVFLMEVATRRPGDGIMPLYNIATGSSFEEAIIQAALGEPIKYPSPSRYARQVFINHKYGRLKDVKVDGLDVVWFTEFAVRPKLQSTMASSSPSLQEVISLKSRGAELGPLKNNHDRTVGFIIDAPSVEELNVMELKAINQIEILIDTSDR